jgi:hypothetical protein
MKALVWFLLALVVVIVAGVAYLSMNKPGEQAAETSAVPIVGMSGDEEGVPAVDRDETGIYSFVLSEQNESGQNGNVVFSEIDGKLSVLVQVGGSSDAAQPAHIHKGSCPTPGAVAYPLTNVEDGISETTLSTTIAALKSQMPLAVNVHKSASESTVYVACGDVKL